MTCEHCERLAQKIAYLRGEADPAPPLPFDRLRTRYPTLNPGSLRVIQGLFLAEGAILSEHVLEGHASRNPKSVSSSLIKVHVSHIRKAMGAECLQNVWGHGYRMTRVGRAQVYAAMFPDEAQPTAAEVSEPEPLTVRPTRAPASEPRKFSWEGRP